MSTEPDVLSVQIAGGGGEPERVLILSRPVAGRVRVQGWSSDGAPGEREMPVDDVLEMVERAVRDRRRVSEDLYTVRRWLGT